MGQIHGKQIKDTSILLDKINPQTGQTLTLVGTSKIQQPQAPLVGDDLANKSYVDSIAAGLNPKEAVNLATIANITATYSNGASGVGAILYGTGVLLVDGVTASVSDRILIKNQSNAFENGIYDVGTAGTNWTLVRSSDFNGSPAEEIDGGEFAFVMGGNTLADTGWVVSQPSGVAAVVGSTSIMWSQFSSAGVINAGAGLVQNGNIIDFQTGDNSLIVGATNAVVNVDNLTIKTGASGLQVMDNGITETQLNSSVAGAGLTGGNGIPLTVNTGSGIVMVNDTLTSPVESLAQTLIAGNNTGTKSIVMDDTTVVMAKNGGGQLDLRKGGNDVAVLSNDSGVLNSSLVQLKNGYSTLAVDGWKSAYEITKQSGTLNYIIDMYTTHGVISIIDNPVAGGVTQNGLHVIDTNLGMFSAPIEGTHKINALLASPSSSVNMGVKNSVALGGSNLVLKTNNTAYATQIGHNKGGFETLLQFTIPTANRTQTFQDKDGVIALLSDINAGDVTGVTAGAGLSGGGTFGTLQLDIELTTNGGLTFSTSGNAGTLQSDYAALSSNLAGNGLVQNGSTIDVNTGNGLTILNDTIGALLVVNSGLTFSTGAIDINLGTGLSIFNGDIITNASLSLITATLPNINVTSGSSIQTALSVIDTQLGNLEISDNISQDFSPAAMANFTSGISVVSSATFSKTSDGVAWVYLNGVQQVVGGTISAAWYFTNDSGASARANKKPQAGDQLAVNISALGFNVSGSNFDDDIIEVKYDALV